MGALHGGLTSGQRMLRIDKFNRCVSRTNEKFTVQMSCTLFQFFRSKYLVVIATDYGARGFDFRHVDHIINLDFPKDTQTYIHR